MKRSLVLWGAETPRVAELGRAVAERTGRPLVDGSSLAREGLLRRLGRADSQPEEVLLLEPGALFDRSLRLEVLDRAVLVALGPQSDLEPLTVLQQPTYEESHLRIGAGEPNRAEVTDRIIELWQRSPVAVGAGDKSYCVDVAPRWDEAGLLRALAGASSVLFISDDNVQPLHGERLERLLETSGKPVASAIMPAGEQHKNLATASRLWERALALGIDRRSVVVALGGGVVTDVSGFVAACWMRGLSWIAMPTTLLGMVDASVGGKTAVDLEQAKNAVGAFWQPKAVFCGTDVLGTEPVRGYRGAFAEVVKTALIGDPDLFALLEERSAEVDARDGSVLSEIVGRCVRVKARVVSLDAREGGVRATLNLGHTIGHALEADGGYSALTHGEAVSLGLVAALHIGVALGATPSALLERTVRLLVALGLPARLDPAALRRSVELLGYDKKRVGRELSFVVAHGVGSVQIHRMSVAELGERTLALAASLDG